VWAMCYSLEQARHTSAPNPSNTLLIYRGVDSGRKAVTKEKVGRRVSSVLLF
jgi:hypothetical protein